MARNEEKAQNLFNRWTTFKKDFHAIGSNRRPLLASECESLADAEKWRRELVKDISKKIPQMKNGNLGEYKIREMNDEINKMMRQKHYWEIRVRELGGTTDFKKMQYHFDIEGQELPGAPGYKYYGAAKDLPGIRELFAEHDDDMASRKKRKSRKDLAKFITPDYYGYRDDDDGLLAPKEAFREAELVRDSVKQFNEKKRRLAEEVKRSGGMFGASELAAVLSDDKEAEEDAAQIARLLDQYQYQGPVRGVVSSSAAAGVTVVVVAGGGGVQPTSVSSKINSKTGLNSSTADCVATASADSMTQDEIQDLLFQEQKRALLNKLLN